MVISHTFMRNRELFYKWNKGSLFLTVFTIPLLITTNCRMHSSRCAADVLCISSDKCSSLPRKINNCHDRIFSFSGDILFTKKQYQMTAAWTRNCVVPSGSEILASPNAVIDSNHSELFFCLSGHLESQSIIHSIFLFPVSLTNDML